MVGYGVRIGGLVIRREVPKSSIMIAVVYTHCSKSNKKPTQVEFKEIQGHRENLSWFVAHQQ